MITAWRLVKTRYATAAFDGEGARLYGGRWNTPGTAVVYTSSTASLAVLEVLVHLRSSAILPSYSMIPVEFDEGMVETLSLETLPSDWGISPPPPVVQAIGDRWVRENRSAVLCVPSVIVPSERIYLLNLGHPDFVRLKTGAPTPFTLDARFRR